MNGLEWREDDGGEAYHKVFRRNNDIGELVICKLDDIY